VLQAGQVRSLVFRVFPGRWRDALLDREI